MISFKATTLNALAVVNFSLTLLLAVLVAHVTVEAQQQMSDNDVYRMVNNIGHDSGPWPHLNDQNQDYYSRPSLAAEEYSQGQSGQLEHELLAAENSDDLLLAKAQFEAMLQERYLRQLQQHQQQQPVEPIGQTIIGEVKKDSPNNLMLAHDLSSHWPAAGIPDEQQEGPQLSRPVNDPQEFEAKLGQLTDALNHNMPNTRMRQQLLMGLLNESRRADTEEENEDEEEEVEQSLMPMIHFPQGQLLNGLKQMVRSAANSQEDDALSSSSTGTDLETSETSSSEYLTGGGGSEYIDRPLELSGHQYVQGGAGEGRQLLGPEGTFENVQVIKTDSAIPSYCDPPNPCPIGYTAKDGCLEEFVNLASFSREYQAKQKCSCDNEHSLFNCASPNLATTTTTTTATDKQANSLGSRDVPESTREDEEDNELAEEPVENHSTTSDKLATLARTIQNRFGDLASVQRLIGKQRDQQEPLSLGAGNDDANSDYLVRSARKLSSLDMHHKVDLD